MAKKSVMKFIDSYNDKDFIKVEKSEDRNEIYISGLDSLNNHPFEILLNKATAIRFAKTLRTEINKIKE